MRWHPRWVLFCYREITMIFKPNKAKLCSLFCSLLTPFIILISMMTDANSSSVDDYYLHFKAGQYEKAIEVLETSSENNSVNNSTSNNPSKSYLKGLAYSRLQEYDKAIAQFEIAIREKSDTKDLYYEYGQSLYAANDLRKARSAFKISSENKYNQPASLYYVAHISQILEEFETAKNNFWLVLKDPETNIKMKQISQFQLAETLLAIAREKSKGRKHLVRHVDTFILPMLRAANKVDLSTPVAFDISQRIIVVMQEFELDPDQMVNGRRISQKRYSGSFSQKIKFDDNITQANEKNNIQQTQKESYVLETEAYGKYDFVFKKRFIVSPEARMSFTHHGDQTSSNVFTNDSFVLNVNLKNKYEHKFYERPASLLFDIDYTKTYKDWRQTQTRDFYANSTTLNLGESFSYFSFGETSVKIKRKFFRGESENIHNNTNSISINQTAFLPIQHLLIFLLDASFIDNFNNKSTNTNTFLTRIDYLIPEILTKWTLGLAVAATVTDTKDQEATRGTEFTFNPSIDFTKEINKFTKIVFNFEHTKNNSKSTSYDYRKNVFSTDLRFSF